MKRILLISLIAFAFMTSKAQESFGGLMFSARLDTTQQEGHLWVPSSGNGVAGFSYHDDTIWFDITANGLTGPIVSAHIHSESSGSVEYSLTAFIDRNKLKGYIPGISFGNSELKLFLDGEYYVNIHTASNPDGEISGRIVPETDYNFLAVLDMSQAGQTNPPDHTPLGLGSFNLGMDNTELECNLLVNDLTAEITNAHLHYGAPGVNGPVIIPLTQFKVGNKYQGVFDLSSLVNPSAFLDSLTKGSVYVNVHTSGFPAGEIRGQLHMNRILSFDSWMDSGQETSNTDPTTPVDAAAISNFSVNSSIDTIWLNIQSDHLSGPIQGAHFHSGKAGNSGPVVVDLTDFIQGTMVSGFLTPTSPNFTSDMDFEKFVDRVLHDDIYINLHTSLNPAGEVRGQPSSLSREGVIYSLCPSQETGSVTAAETAQGSGFVSLDRNYRNLHYGHSVSFLSSTLTMSHFHHALPGVNGPVIYTLPIDSIQTGFWNDAAFTADIADQFESGEIYANFHTSANPAGEVRGQVDIGEFCSAITSLGELIPSLSASVSIFPNPVSSSATMNFTVSESAFVTLSVFDLVGGHKQIFVNRNMSEGFYITSIDAQSLSGGLYFYRLVMNGKLMDTGKFMVIK